MKKLLTLVALLLPAGSADACHYGLGGCFPLTIAYPVPTITYFAPQVTYYAPPPVVQYINPAPVVAAPAPAPVYAAPAPCPVQAASYAVADPGYALGIGYGTSLYGFRGFGAGFYGTFYGHRFGFFNRFGFRHGFGFHRVGFGGGFRRGFGGFGVRGRSSSFAVAAGGGSASIVQQNVQRGLFGRVRSVQTTAISAGPGGAAFVQQQGFRARGRGFRR